MRTVPRLKGLKKWAENELCAGRLMKAPTANQKVDTINRQQPKCYLAWMPSRTDAYGGIVEQDVQSVVPGIIILPKGSYAQHIEEKRFDRYNKVSRPLTLGSTLSIDMLFSVWEPGIRLPGFVDSARNGNADMNLIREGTEEGLFTLLDWMDDCKELLLSTKVIPGTDLYVENEDSIVYSLFTDQSFVVDKRPIYYGFITVTFNGYADTKPDSGTDQLLL